MTTETQTPPATTTTTTTARRVPKDARWYVVHTYSGREDKACENLKQRIESMDVGDYIFDAVVPKQTVVKMTEGGEPKSEEETMYRGYLLVRMKMPRSHSFDTGPTRTRARDAEDKEEAKTALDVLRNTPGVINFISVEDDRDGTRRPIPLTDDEAMAMIHGDQTDSPEISFGFEAGDVVTITDGPFNDFSGTVDEVAENGKVKVTVSFFGQDTPVELDFTSVEKA